MYRYIYIYIDEDSCIDLLNDFWTSVWKSPSTSSHMIAVDNFHAILRGISNDHVIHLGIGNGIDHDQVTRPETYIRTNKFINFN